MLKRTFAGLAFVLAATAFNAAPASAFGWCDWGFRSYSPRAYSYTPRAYYRPRARLYRPAFYGRAYYRPRIGLYRPAFYGRTYYRPRARFYRPALYGRAFYRPGVRVHGRAFRPAVARGFRRSEARVSGPRARAFYRPAARGDRGLARGGMGLDRSRYRGRLP
jgi:hypothetical protein